MIPDQKKGLVPCPCAKDHPYSTSMDKQIALDNWTTKFMLEI